MCFSSWVRQLRTAGPAGLRASCPNLQQRPAGGPWTDSSDQILQVKRLSCSFQLQNYAPHLAGYGWNMGSQMCFRAVPQSPAQRPEKHQTRSPRCNFCSVEGWDSHSAPGHALLFCLWSMHKQRLALNPAFYLLSTAQL